MLMCGVAHQSGLFSTPDIHTSRLPAARRIADPRHRGRTALAFRKHLPPVSQVVTKLTCPPTFCNASVMDCAAL